MGPGFWADVLVVFHTAFVGFVVIGQLLILLGLLCGWSWVRNPWFRSIHLAAILIVATEAYFKYTCPLTTWENQLRELAHEPIRGKSFVGQLMNKILFDENYDPDLIHKLHLAFGGLVLLTFLLAPPRFRGTTDRPSSRPGRGPAPAATAS